MLVLFQGESGVRDTVRFIEEKLNVGLWSWDIETNQMDWSVGLFRLLGFDPKSVKPSFELLMQTVFREDRRYAREAEQLIRNGLHFDLDYRIVRSDGRVRSIRNRGETVSSDRVNTSLAVGVIADTTTLSAERQIKKDFEDHYEALVSAVGSSVWIMRPDGWVLELRHPQNRLQSDTDNELGSRWEADIHPDDLETVKSTIANAVSANTGFKFEFRGRTTDQSYRWFASQGYPVRGPHGEVREFVGFTTDIDDARNIPEKTTNPDLILTGAQIRAARGLVGWSVKNLSEHSGVSSNVIRRLETNDGFAKTENSEGEAIRDALIKSGAKFFYPPNSKPLVGPR